MNDKEFLEWLIDRLVHVYGESPNMDFIHRLRKISHQLPQKESDWKYVKPIIGLNKEGQPIIFDSWDDKITKSINYE